MMAPVIVLCIGGGVRAARRRSLAKLFIEATKENTDPTGTGANPSRG